MRFEKYAFNFLAILTLILGLVINAVGRTTDFWIFLIAEFLVVACVILGIWSYKDIKEMKQ